MAVKKKVKILIIFIIFILVILLAGLITWNVLQSPVDSKDNSEIEVVIPEGSGASKIGEILKEKELIRSADFFKLYLKITKPKSLKATTYKLKKNMSLEQIIKALEKGNSYNPDEVNITIQEGLNMREVAKIISSKTSNSYEDVINKSNDEQYIRRLINKYWFITEDVLNKEIYYKLEGYIYPDTYTLANEEVDVEYIFDKMLDEMEKKLESYKYFDYSNMSIHERLTLASMVEKESSVSTDRSKMASVFVNRLKLGMNLGSDVTAKYANKIDEKRALTKAEFQINSPYNTRLSNGSMNGKLPIGPISTISKSSIDAAFNPDDTEYIYFISNIDTLETFFFEEYSDFMNKKEELASVNKGY